MLKSELYGFELHQNLINYSVSIIKDGNILKEYNPRKWISIDEAKEILSKEIDEFRKQK